jgi:hypothetical protein
MRERTALILTGHARTFDSVWNNLKNHIIDVLNPDIFGFMWSDTFGFYKHVYDTEHPTSKLGYDPSSPALPDEFIRSVINRLQPTKFQLMDPNDISDELDYLTNKHSDVRSPWIYHRERPKYQSYWSRTAAWRLKRQYEKQEGFIYDRVILSRWDVDQTGPIDFQSYPMDRLVLPSAYTYGALCDFWVMGPSPLMDIFCNALTTIDLTKKTPGFHTNPHEWTKSHLDYYKVPYTIADIPIELRR